MLNKSVSSKRYPLSSKRNPLFTLYFKQLDMAVSMSRQELVNLIKESTELLELIGETQHLPKKQINM